MKDLWLKKDDKINIINEGICLHFSKDVDKELRSTIIAFVKWLRKLYLFPVKVIVYIKDTPYIVNLQTGEKTQSPYARIATGDYRDVANEKGLYNATCDILCSLAHEITHYFQWLSDKDLSENQARRKAIKIVYKYLDQYDSTYN